MTRLIKRASAEARAFKQRKASAYNGSEKLQPPRLKRRPNRRARRQARSRSAAQARLRARHFRRSGAASSFLDRMGAGRDAPVEAVRIELEYAQQMMAWLLFLETPARIVQLGLGTGALTKFAHRFLPHAKVEAVELNPAVIVAARTMFALPPDDARLVVHEADAWDFVNDPANRGTTGVIQIDLYDATARGPVLDSVAFYRGCAAASPTRASRRSTCSAIIELRAQHEAPERGVRSSRGRAAGSARRQPDRDRVLRPRARRVVRTSTREADRRHAQAARPQLGEALKETTGARDASFAI
jgi:hypothetical protein